MFRPCPLVAATFLTQQATQTQHAWSTSQAAGSPSAAQLPCHTCQTKHTAASSAAADKEEHPQPARRNCSHQGSQWKEKYCLFRPRCPLSCHMPQTATIQPQNARTTSQAAGSPSAAQLPCHTCQTSKSKEAYSSIVSSSRQRETSSASPSQLLSSGQSVEGEVLLVSSLVSACCCHISHTASNKTATCMVHITSGW